MWAFYSIWLLVYNFIWDISDFLNHCGSPFPHFHLDWWRILMPSYYYRLYFSKWQSHKGVWQLVRVVLVIYQQPRNGFHLPSFMFSLPQIYIQRRAAFLFVSTKLTLWLLPLRSNLLSSFSPYSEMKNQSRAESEKRISW